MLRQSKGDLTGRGIGIIDTIHFVEVARAIEISKVPKPLHRDDLRGVKNGSRII